MTVCADAMIPMNSTTNNVKIAVTKPRLVMALFPASVHHQGQHTGFSLFPFAAAPPRTRSGLGHQVGECRILQNLCSGIAHVEEHLVKGAVVGIASDEAP